LNSEWRKPRAVVGFYEFASIPRLETSMKRTLCLFALNALLAFTSFAQVPSNLVVENIPPIDLALVERVTPYFEFRTASFNSWHPERREMLISTRFGNTSQIHSVAMPGGARRQITFYPDRVGGGAWQKQSGRYVVFTKDIGGGEFFQIYRYDPVDGSVVLLTDGKSRNERGPMSRDGNLLAYTSTRRNGRDSDIYVVEINDPKSDRKVADVAGGGWGATDWSPDRSTLAVNEYISANESYVYLMDAKTGAMKLLTPKGGPKAAYVGGRFSNDGKSLYLVTDDGVEFLQLVKLDLATGKKTPLTSHIKWDVEDADLSPDGKTIAFVTNENGIGVLHLLDTASGKEIPAPKLPIGNVGNVDFHENGRDLAFNLVSNKSPSDVFSVDLTTGKIDQWTFSETGGLNTGNNADPSLVRMKSFDGLEISAFVYRPNAQKFPGKRPVMINIHGGPEGQFQPGFLGRNNYLINEMGIAFVAPNVRGSSGYGKTYLALDNGFKREDTVRDIGTVIDWIRKDPALDGDRVIVYGGSYGGYMVLASMIHHADKLRAGIDVVGISSFVTFLDNTQDYRRDLRRAEYGDEREPKMKEFLQKISPLTNASKIRDPLFVIQGFNDPRVPYTEAEQIAKAARTNNNPVWFLMAKDEGHGFAKKSNADFQFLAMIKFMEEFLLK
jgi:dipeptidyl aminopeptidase/acylaminoacyl peptidase